MSCIDRYVNLSFQSPLADHSKPSKFHKAKQLHTSILGASACALVIASLVAAVAITILLLSPAATIVAPVLLGMGIFAPIALCALTMTILSIIALVRISHLSDQANSYAGERPLYDLDDLQDKKRFITNLLTKTNLTENKAGNYRADLTLINTILDETNLITQADLLDGLNKGINGAHLNIDTTG